MKKCILLLACVTLTGGEFLFAQAVTKWKQDPYDNRFFIANHGQFSGRDALPGSQILYGVNHQAMQVYFNAGGFSYRFDEIKRSETPSVSGREEERLLSTTSYFLNMKWVGANQTAEVKGADKASHYYNYQTPDARTGIDRVPAYRKLVYKNLYPGIDVEYTFPEKGGLKYVLVVHPGADPSLVKMKYTGADKMVHDKSGNIRFTLDGMGELTDNAPYTYYADSHFPVRSAFVLEGDEVRFSLGEYDRKKTLVIDPWITNPLFTTLNRAYDVNVHSSGDVYVLGGGTGTGGGGGYQLKKFNPAGALQWTFTPTANNWFGDFDIDTAGDAYLTTGTGATLTKVSAAGTLVFTKTIPGVSEPWRCRINCSNNRFYYGGGGTSVSGTLYSFVEVDANAGTIVNDGCSMTGSINTKEARALEIDAANGDAYGLIISPLQNSVAATNRLVRLDANLNVIYDVQSGYLENEYGFAYTNTSGLTGFNGFNGIAIDYGSPNFYTYDGLTIIKRDKATGTQQASVAVKNTIFDMNSGIAVDRYGFVFVGTQDSIKKYDCNLNFISGMNVGGVVYDLCIGKNKNELLACGNGFVMSVNYPSLPQLVTSPSSSCGSNCQGTAKVQQCDTMSTFTYAWSNGQTTARATGLCPGTYTVIVGKNMLCKTFVDTLTATVTGGSGGGATLALGQTNLLCNGAANGSATVTASGGGLPYTYSWNNGHTGANATGLSAGTYTITVTDSAGCISTQTVAITQPSQIILAANGSTICQGETANISANATGGTGNITYSWNPGGQTNNSISVTPTVTTTYTVTATDANGCTRTLAVTVTVNPKPTAAFTATPPSGTAPLSVTFNNTSTGGTTYSWTFGDGGNSTSQNTSHTYISNGTYTVKLVVTSSNGCKDSVTFTIVAEELSSLIVPNVFSPNGDAYNDLFTIQSTGLKDLYVEIYDRWGLKMSSFNTVSGGWDGKSASGKDAPEGTYYYILKAHGFDEKEYNLTGYLMLLRK